MTDDHRYRVRLARVVRTPTPIQTVNTHLNIYTGSKYLLAVMVHGRLISV